MKSSMCIIWLAGLSGSGKTTMLSGRRHDRSGQIPARRRGITSLTEKTDGLAELLEDRVEVEPGSTVGFHSYAPLVN